MRLDALPANCLSPPIFFLLWMLAGINDSFCCCCCCSEFCLSSFRPVLSLHYASATLWGVCCWRRYTSSAFGSSTKKKTQLFLTQSVKALRFCLTTHNKTIVFSRGNYYVRAPEIGNRPESAMKSSSSGLLTKRAKTVQCFGLCER